MKGPAMTTTPINITSALTLGELQYLQEASGSDLMDFADLPDLEFSTQLRFLIALVTLLKRREDPQWTEEDTKNIPYNEIKQLINLDDSTLLKLGLAEEIEVAAGAPKSE